MKNAVRCISVSANLAKTRHSWLSHINLAPKINMLCHFKWQLPQAQRIQEISASTKVTAWTLSTRYQQASSWSSCGQTIPIECQTVENKNFLHPHSQTARTTLIFYQTCYLVNRLVSKEHNDRTRFRQECTAIYL